MLKGLLANAFGRFWSIISNFLFIPLYIKYLGIENYGVIGFSIVLTGVMAIMDVGLTSTLSREFANAENDNNRKIEFFRSLETVYFIIVAIIFIVFLFGAELVAKKWLNVKNIDLHDLANFVRIIGVGVGAQLIARFYNGGLLGLERHVLSNAFQVSWGILRNALVIIPLTFYPSLYTFLIWQTVSSFLYVIVLRFEVARQLGSVQLLFKRPIIQKHILKASWQFAGGMLLISVVAALNLQFDKLIISKMLSITTLGFYTLAVALAQSILTLTNPVSATVLPRFTALFSSGESIKAQELFRSSFFLVSIMIFSISATLFFRSSEVLYVWTGNQELVDGAKEYLPYMAVGVAFLALQVIPFNVAIANGVTKINNYIGLISLVLTIPGYLLMTQWYGAIGAATVWAVAQLIIMPVFLYFVMKLFITNYSFLRIMFLEVLLPLITSAVLGWTLSQITYMPSNRIVQMIIIGFSTLLTFAFNLAFQYRYARGLIRANMPVFNKRK